MQSVHTTAPEGGGGPSLHRLSRGFGEASRFWEPRRLVYNLLLTAALVGWVAGTWPHFRPALTSYHLLQIAVLGFLANVCYSAGYVAELVLLSFARSASLMRMRSALWVVGTVLAILFENYWIADEIYPFIGR